MIGDIFADLKFTLRMVRRSPGMTAAAVLTLALGIGANSAIYSVIDGVLLRPLPYPDSQALVSIYGESPRFKERLPLSYPMFQDLLAQTGTLQNVGAWKSKDANLVVAGGPPARILVGVASPSLFPTIGVAPTLGRNFLPDEAVAGNDHVAVLDWGFWQRRFGGAEVVGKSLRLDGIDRQIIGILPRDFRFGGQAIDVWTPLSTSDPNNRGRLALQYTVVGRRRADATPMRVNADLDAFARRQAEAFPQFYPKDLQFRFRAQKLLDAVVGGDTRLVLLLLLGAVAFVLLISCANVANLLLARAATRQREMAIRAAIGAARGRLARQLLTESLFLAFTGGALGLFIATWAVSVLVRLSPDAVPRLADVALDARVFLFTFVVAVVTGIAFGMAPALAASRPDLQDGLRDGTYGTTSSRGRLRGALVVAEVALALVLLVGTGLMVRSFVGLLNVDPGFRTDQALMLRISLSPSAAMPSETDRDHFVSFFQQATQRLGQLPGISAVGGSSDLPLNGDSSELIFEIEGYTPPTIAEAPAAQIRQATPGWQTAMAIPLLRGRFLSDSDGPTAPRVVVVNAAFARQFFPEGGALGKHVRMPSRVPEPWATIVGVIGDVRGYALDAPPRPEMYWPYQQMRTFLPMALVLRTNGDATKFANAARAAIAEIDPQQPVFDVEPLTALVSASLGPRRFTLTLMVIFGVVALLLAGIGIYSVMAYNVAQRTQEFGIRAALGARPTTLLAMVLKDGMRLVGIGLIIGAGAAVALGRVLASLLFGISTTDVFTYVVIISILTVVALSAILFPARRAMRVVPMQALRAE